MIKYLDVKLILKNGLEDSFYIFVNIFYRKKQPQVTIKVTCG